MNTKAKFSNLSLLILVFSLLVGLYLVTNNLFNANNGYSYYEFIGAFVFFLGLNAALLFLERKSIKHSLPVIVAFGVLLIIDVIATLTLKSPQDMSVLGLHGEYWDCHFETTNFYRFQSIAKFVAVLLMNYGILVIFPQKVNTKGKILAVLITVIFVCLILILYSLIFEFTNYINFVKCLIARDADGVFLSSPKSVFPNKNSFAFILFINIVASLLLHHYKRYNICFINIALSYILIVFTICKTIIILSLVLTLTYIIYRLIVTFKERKKRNLIIIGILCGSLLLVMCIVLLIPLLRESIFDMFFNIGDRTIEVRQYIWSNAFLVLNGAGWFIGRGFGTFNALITVYNHSDPGGGEGFTTNAHNGYLELIGETGILYLVVAILGQAYLVYRCIKHFKEDKELSLFTMLLMLLLQIYMIFEVMTPTVSSSLEYMTMTALLFAPILSLKYREEKQQIECKNIEKPSKNDAFVTIFAIISIVVLSGLFASSRLWVGAGLTTTYIIILCVVVMTFFALSLWFVFKDKRNITAILELVIMAIVLSGAWYVISIFNCTLVTTLLAIAISLFATISINSVFKSLPLSAILISTFEYLNLLLDKVFAKLDCGDNLSRCKNS